MKLLITGANGFLGKYVTSEAVKQGYDVRALVRPATRNIPENWLNNKDIEVVKGDLRIKRGLTELLTGCDSVIHLAAVKAGDLYEQFSGSVIATENLLTAMEETGISRLVIISSFSVYEYMKRVSWGVIDEESPLSVEPFKRDEYCQTKMVQEGIAVEAAEKNGWNCVVLRPGVIFGRDNLWTARLGSQSGENNWLTIGKFASLPLTYVENCASAIILAAGYDDDERITVLNVVDDGIPSQRKYISFLKKQKKLTGNKIKIRFIPWILMRCIARAASIFNALFFHGNGKIPGLFVPERLHARCKPLRYNNEKIKSILGWAPEYSWKEGVLRSINEKGSV